MEACAALFFATIGAFPPAGAPRNLEYEEYKLWPEHFVRGDVTRATWAGWTAFRGDGSYAGEKLLAAYRYVATKEHEWKYRWSYSPGAGMWTSGERAPGRCRYPGYEMPRSDGICTEAAREYLPGFRFIGRREGRVRYWNVEGTTSRLVELDPRAGCEVLLWKAGFALGGVIVAPTYKYEVVKIVLGEPPAEMFRRE